MAPEPELPAPVPEPELPEEAGCGGGVVGVGWVGGLMYASLADLLLRVVVATTWKENPKTHHTQLLSDPLMRWSAPLLIRSAADPLADRCSAGCLCPAPGPLSVFEFGLLA